MSEPLAGSAESSGKKRKLDNDDRTDRAIAKKQRRAETRQRLEAEAEAAGKAREDATQAPVNDSDKKKKKKKKSRKKHSRSGIGEQHQDDLPTTSKQPNTSENKKVKRKRKQRRENVAVNPVDAAKKALGVEKPLKSNSHLPQEKVAKIQAWAEHSESESSKAAAKKAKKKSKNLGVSKPKSGWRLSPATAGRYLDQDPIFVRDGEGQGYLISANSRGMQLLSLDTSLVAFTATAPKGRSIKCFAAGEPTDSMAHFAVDDGSVYTWEWDTDEAISLDFKAPRPIVALASMKGGQSPLIYICPDDAMCDIFVDGSEQALFSTDKTLTSIRVFGDADYIVALGPNTVTIGTKTDIEADLTKYIWTQIPLMSTATCIDARILPTEAVTKKAKPKQPGLSLAIGYTDGQIHLYDDISSVSGQQGRPQLPTPRILHWHREAVSSVKFSQDGNYLISGGKETVLVIWQLQTAKKQFLPHLTSAIERIVVNPKGDRYALQMGDNSIMVLSTSELKPVANFAGLQMSPKQDTIAGPIYSNQAATLHPQNPSQILLSVPSTRPDNREADIISRAFLQTFDSNTSRHISRQALTRNNVTDFNLGPEGHPIAPPDACQVAISHDGSWLATVDEWMPPAADLEHLVSDSSDVPSLRASRREVYLKFWKWEGSEGLWTLTTRVDSPSSAAATSPGASKILALISNPSANGFATVGEDCCVKMWKPKKRTRHGVAITDRSDTELFEWTCKRTIQLPRPQERVDSPFSSTESKNSTTACLSYAGDGSMLAASLSSSSATTTEEAQVVHFINPATGDSIPKPGLTGHGTVAMGFLDQYFIAVDRLAAYVWDLINDTIVYKVKLASKKHPYTYASPTLTIDAAGGTFALAMQVRETGKTKVAVYGPKEPVCLWESTFGSPVEAVLAGAGAKGYTLLFSDATVRTLAPATGSAGRMRRFEEPERAKSAVEPTTIVKPTTGEPDEDMDIDQESASRRPNEDEEDDRPVVRPEQLANIFDTAQSFAMPPVRDMFDAVVGLFSRRLYSKPAVEVV